MGTSTTIGVINANTGKVKTASCHYDGYLSHMAPVLIKEYSNILDANKLVDFGHVSAVVQRHQMSIDKQVEPVEHDNLSDAIKSVGVLYLFDEKTSQWHCVDKNDAGDWFALSTTLVSLYEKSKRTSLIALMSDLPSLNFRYSDDKTEIHLGRFVQSKDKFYGRDFETEFIITKETSSTDIISFLTSHITSDLLNVEALVSYINTNSSKFTLDYKDVIVDSDTSIKRLLDISFGNVTINPMMYVLAAPEAYFDRPHL